MSFSRVSAKVGELVTFDKDLKKMAENSMYQKQFHSKIQHCLI